MSCSSALALAFARALGLACVGAAVVAVVAAAVVVVAAVVVTYAAAAAAIVVVFVSSIDSHASFGLLALALKGRSKPKQYDLSSPPKRANASGESVFYVFHVRKRSPRPNVRYIRKKTTPGR